MARDSSVSWGVLSSGDDETCVESCCGVRLGGNAGVHQSRSWPRWKAKAPSGDQWLHENQGSYGYRVQVHLNKGKKRVFTHATGWTGTGRALLRDRRHVGYSRSGHPRRRSGRHPRGPHQLPPNFRRNSPRADRTGWSTTHSTCSGGTAISGKLPQVERKRMLSRPARRKTTSGILSTYSEHLTGDGQEDVLAHATKLNFEGIVSKNAQAPYRSDRNEGWPLKIKSVQQGKFPVIPASSRIPPAWPRCISWKARKARTSDYMGKVGTGWSRDRLEPDQETARYRRQPEIQADEADQETEGHVGRADLLRGRGISATSLPKGCCAKARSRASSETDTFGQYGYPFPV